MKELAVLYFEGRISLEDEVILFDFISTSEMNSKLFRSWEKDWMSKRSETEDLSSEWNLLQARIETRQAIAPLLSARKNLLTLKRVAAVAAVLVVTILSTLIISDAISVSAIDRVFVVETPNGEKSRIALPDGSVAWINSSSKLSYDADFGDKNRSVILDGEAYFEVNKKDNFPFTVKTRGYDVVVKGTKFNVSSYAEDMKVATVLMEGLVDIVRGNEVLSLIPGESIELDINAYSFHKEQVNTEQYRSWIDNKIEYDAIPLRELLNRLSRQYDAKIHLEDDGQQARHLNISIKNNESLEEILNGLSLAIPMSIEHKGQDIYIKLK